MNVLAVKFGKCDNYYEIDTGVLKHVKPSRPDPFIKEKLRYGKWC